MKKPTKIIKAWGGFSNGRLDLQEIDRGWGGFGGSTERGYAIYKTRTRALQRYDDVRPIEIHVKPK